MINMVEMTDYLDNDLEELFETGTHVLKFYKDGCAPCKELANELNQLLVHERAEATTATIYNVNVGQCPEVAGEFSIFSIPTMVFLKDGEEYERTHGVIKKEEILELVK